MEKLDGIVRVDGLPIVSAAFNWSVGALMQEFIMTLAKKKILGAKCPKCGYTLTPPRTRCPKCNAKMGSDDLIELSGRGKLVSHTLAHVDLDGKGAFVDLDKPRIIGAIKLDGAESTIFAPIAEIAPEKVKQGMAVSLVWNTETKGAISDIKHFKPA